MSMKNKIEKTSILIIDGSNLSPEKISQSIKLNYELSVSESAKNEVKKIS